MTLLLWVTAIITFSSARFQKEHIYESCQHISQAHREFLLVLYLSGHDTIEPHLPIAPLLPTLIHPSFAGKEPAHTMALPVVKSLLECTDFSKTVVPYLPQLYDLPQQVFENYRDFTALKNIYLATNPVISGFAFSLFLFPVFLIVSEINRNYSQVDRCWSILPTLYNAHFVLYAHMAGLPTSRLDNLLAASCVWSVCSLGVLVIEDNSLIICYSFV